MCPVTPAATPADDCVSRRRSPRCGPSPALGTTTTAQCGDVSDCESPPTTELEVEETKEEEDSPANVMAVDDEDEVAVKTLANGFSYSMVPVGQTLALTAPVPHVQA